MERKLHQVPSREQIWDFDSKQKYQETKPPRIIVEAKDKRISDKTVELAKTVSDDVFINSLAKDGFVKITVMVQLLKEAFEIVRKLEENMIYYRCFPEAEHTKRYVIKGLNESYSGLEVAKEIAKKTNIIPFVHKYNYDNHVNYAVLIRDLSLQKISAAVPKLFNFIPLWEKSAGGGFKSGIETTVQATSVPLKSITAQLVDTTLTRSQANTELRSINKVADIHTYPVTKRDPKQKSIPNLQEVKEVNIEHFEEASSAATEYSLAQQMVQSGMMFQEQMNQMAQLELIASNLRGISQYVDIDHVGRQLANFNHILSRVSEVDRMNETIKFFSIFTIKKKNEH